MSRLLDDDRTDGVIALHRGAVVLEEYRRGMRDDDVHLLQSVSKSITGVLAGVLAGRGALRAENMVTEYVPELAGSDLRRGVGQGPARHARRDAVRRDLCRSRLRHPRQRGAVRLGARAAACQRLVGYLRTLDNHRPHGGRFEYRSILTDVLGLVLERAAGRPFAEALGAELWQPLGAETDAYVTIDAEGFAVADGGICVSLRDLARFGRMVAAEGVADGRRIVAAAWLQDTLAGGEDSRDAFAQDEHSVEMPGGHYRSQWWVPGDGALLGLGIHGQFLFVDRTTDTVIAVVSTSPTSLDPERHRAGARCVPGDGRGPVRRGLKRSGEPVGADRQSIATRSDLEGVRLHRDRLLGGRDRDPHVGPALREIGRDRRRRRGPPRSWGRCGESDAAAPTGEVGAAEAIERALGERLADPPPRSDVQLDAAAGDPRARA